MGDEASCEMNFVKVIQQKIKKIKIKKKKTYSQF